MVSHETYTQVTFVLLVAIAVPSTVFLIAYHLLSKGYWRKSPMGHNIMVMAATIAVLANLYLVEAFLGRGRWFPWLLWAVLVVISLVWWHRLYLLFDVNHPRLDAPRRRATDQVKHDLDHTETDDDMLQRRLRHEDE